MRRAPAKAVQKGACNTLAENAGNAPQAANGPLTGPVRPGTVYRLGFGGTMFVRRISFVLAALAAVLGFASQANAANWLEKNFWMSGPRYSGKLPECDSGWALGTIQLRFGGKESAFWNSRLGIVKFDGVHETANRPWAPDTIPRRFCTARALLSDGVWRPVHYLIGEDMGMIGSTWDVEWCVVGLDRNWSSNPACRMMRP